MIEHSSFYTETILPPRSTPDAFIPYDALSPIYQRGKSSSADRGKQRAYERFFNREHSFLFYPQDPDITEIANGAGLVATNATIRPVNTNESPRLIGDTRLSILSMLAQPNVVAGVITEVANVVRLVSEDLKNLQLEALDPKTVDELRQYLRGKMLRMGQTLPPDDAIKIGQTLASQAA